MFCLCLYLFIFSDFCHTNYFNTHLTDLYKIWRDDITLAVNERPEIIFFRSLEGCCHGNQFSLTESTPFCRVISPKRYDIGI